jgi:hypothetical protein
VRDETAGTEREIAERSVDLLLVFTSTAVRLIRPGRVSAAGCLRLHQCLFSLEREGGRLAVEAKREQGGRGRATWWW